MGHSPELIQRITALIRSDYPLDQYSLAIEQVIPGTRMFPDIQVLDATGRIVCAVEIGYTRPEKLTTYRHKLKIPDVRWYDKAGKLHGDVQEKTVKVKVETAPTGKFSIFQVVDMVPCMVDTCETYAVIDWNLDVVELSEPMTEAEEGDRFMQMLANLSDYVWTLVITDYTRVWFVCYCDKCGGIFQPERGDAMTLDLMADDLASLNAKRFGREWGERIFRGEWSSVCDFIAEHRGAELIYEDGEFVGDGDVRQSVEGPMSSIRINVARLEM